MQNKQKHIRIVSNIVTGLGVFYLLAVVLFGFIGLWATKNQIHAGADPALLPAILIGVTVLIPLALFGILHIVTGRSFRAGAGWARVSMWILAILNLGNVPLGTAFGAYTLWLLVKTGEDIKAIRQSGNEI